MGIEDLNLNLREHAERILLITSDETTKNSLSRLLEKRAYNWSHALNTHEALNMTSSNIFDVIVLVNDIIEKSPDALVSELRAHANFRRSSILLLQPSLDEQAHTNQSLNTSDVAILKFPCESSNFLIMLSSQLRNRKLKKDDAGLDTRLTAQNAELRDLTNRFKKELKEAQEVQKSLLPKSMPSDTHCTFAATYTPLEAVGGDLFDIWQISPDHYGLFIGDVSGHGLPAAFIGALVKMALSYATKESPELMLAEMNNGVSDHILEGRFVSVEAAIYNSKTRVLKVARGGHPPACLWRSSTKQIEYVRPQGLPIGVAKGAAYKLFQTELEPGDKLLLMTDGLTEASNMEGKLFGSTDMEAVICQAGEKFPIADALKDILQRCEQFTHGRIIKDDITLIGLECLHEPTVNNMDTLR